MALWNENRSEDDKVDIYAVNIELNQVHRGLTYLSLHHQQQCNHDESGVDTDSIDSDNKDEIGDINPKQIGNMDW